MLMDYCHDIARWEGEGGSHGELRPLRHAYETQMNVRVLETETLGRPRLSSPPRGRSRHLCVRRRNTAQGPVAGEFAPPRANARY
jgi:hypothetical protein